MSRRNWIILGLVVLLAAAAVGFYVLRGDSDAPAAITHAGWTVTDHDMTMGDPKAKVVFIEYAAPACPHCAHFNETVIAHLKPEYFDTGKVFYVFRVFPLFPADGVAEKLARCLPKDKYFPFMDALFANQQQWDPEYNVQDIRGGLLQQAKAIGMTEDQFNACLADTKQDDVINKIADDGQKKYNITGTPTLVVNGTVVSPGLVPDLGRMKGFLDTALAGEPL